MEWAARDDAMPDRNGPPDQVVRIRRPWRDQKQSRARCLLPTADDVERLETTRVAAGIAARPANRERGELEPRIADRDSAGLRRARAVGRAAVRPVGDSNIGCQLLPIRGADADPVEACGNTGAHLVHLVPEDLGAHADGCGVDMVVDGSSVHRVHRPAGEPERRLAAAAAPLGDHDFDQDGLPDPEPVVAGRLRRRGRTARGRGRTAGWWRTTRLP